MTLTITLKKENQTTVYSCKVRPTRTTELILEIEKLVDNFKNTSQM